MELKGKIVDNFDEIDMQYIKIRIDPMFADFELDGINDETKKEFLRRLQIIINDRLKDK